MKKKGSIEITSREILILVLVIIIAAIVIGIAISRLDLIGKTLEMLSGQGETIAATA